MKRLAWVIYIGVSVCIIYAVAVPAQEVHALTSCSILSKADIEAEVKQPVGDGQVKGGSAAAPCQYKVGDFGVFSMLVTTAGPGQTADKVKEEMSKMKIAVSDVADLGENSFFSSPGYGMIQLNTFKGSNYLIITMMLPGAAEDAQKTSAVKLMRKALDKL